MSLNKVQIDDLVERVKKGDEKAFRELHKAFSKTTLDIIRRNSNRAIREKAEDLNQDLWIRVFTNIEKYDHKWAFFTWLNSILRNLLADEIRRRKLFEDLQDSFDENFHGEHVLHGQTEEEEKYLLYNASLISAIERGGYPWQVIAMLYKVVHKDEVGASGAPRHIAGQLGDKRLEEASKLLEVMYTQSSGLPGPDVERAFQSLHERLNLAIEDVVPSRNAATRQLLKKKGIDLSSRIKDLKLQDLYVEPEDISQWLYDAEKRIQADLIARFLIERVLIVAAAVELIRYVWHMLVYGYVGLLSNSVGYVSRDLSRVELRTLASKFEAKLVGQLDVDDRAGVRTVLRPVHRKMRQTLHYVLSEITADSTLNHAARNRLRQKVQKTLRAMKRRSPDKAVVGSTALRDFCIGSIEEEFTAWNETARRRVVAEVVQRIRERGKSRKDRKHNKGKRQRRPKGVRQSNP